MSNQLIHYLAVLIIVVALLIAAAQATPRLSARLQNILTAASEIK